MKPRALPQDNPSKAYHQNVILFASALIFSVFILTYVMLETLINI